jgi:hypothetical protein
LKTAGKKEVEKEGPSGKVWIISGAEMLLKGDSMKKAASVMVVFMFALCSIVALAYEGEPDGFRDILWGTHIRDLPFMQLMEVRSDPMSPLKYKVYQRTGDYPRAGGFNLKAYYMFYDDRFFGVTMPMSGGKQKFDKVKEALISRHGEPKIVSKKPIEQFQWSGKTLINLVWSYQRAQGYLGYMYLPAREEMMELKKGKN